MMTVNMTEDEQKAFNKDTSIILQALSRLKKLLPVESTAEGTNYDDAVQALYALRDELDNVPF